jgi:hypothetical protein
LFAQLAGQGRLLHRDWSRYDTGHVVFRPRRMTPRQLAEGYAWSYQRLFSAASIWRRRPADTGAVVPYLGMSVLYKHANPLWRLLIRHRLTAAAWRPLVELTRLRHLVTRRRLAARRGSRTRREHHRGADHARHPISPPSPVPAAGLSSTESGTAAGGAPPGDGMLG